MVLLTPIAAIIAGALAGPLLVALYMLKLRRRPVRVSSTLFWESAVRDLQANVPLRWLRPSWLLLLHLLILALFVLALGRPAIEGSDEAAERVVLIIDRSASMSARDAGDGLTRLDLALQRARETLERLSRRGGTPPAVAIVTLGARPRAITPLTTNIADLRDALARIEPSDQPGDLAAALALVNGLIRVDADESSRPPPAMVILFSDGSFRPGGERSLRGGQLRYDRVGPAADQAAPRLDNVGIVAIAAQRQFDDPATVHIFTRLRSAASEPVGAPIELTIEGETVERRAVVVPPATPEGPGEAVVIFAARRTAGGLGALRVDRADALDADNRAWIMLRPATRVRALVVVPDSEGDGSGEHWLITDVLRELDLRASTVVTRAAYESIIASAGLSADLVVFDRVRPTRPPPVPSISFGVGLDDSAASARPARDTPILSWRRDHPALRDLTLDGVLVGEAATLPEEDETGIDVLARGRHGPLIVLDRRTGVRRLAVAFAPAASNWPLTPSFAVFIASAVEFLALGGDDQAGSWFVAGEPVVVPVPPGTTRATLRGPVEVEASIHGEGGERLATFGSIDRAGAYTLQTQPPSTERTIAVNLLDSVETSIAVESAVVVAGERVEAGASGRGPREIWHWLVAAALALLALEWIVNARLMRA